MPGSLGAESIPLALGAPSGGGSAPVFASALIGAVLLHLMLILVVSREAPRPKPIPETALEVVILRESGETPARALPDAALSRRSRAGESSAGDAVLSAPLDLAETSEEDQAQAEFLSTLDSSARAKPVPTPPDQPPPERETALPDDPPELSDETRASSTAREPPPVLVATPDVDLDAEPREWLDPLFPRDAFVDTARILASRGQEISRLTASLESRTAAYASRARRKSISASTREFRYANYLGAWARKVERIGNLNYPRAAREQHLHGSLILHVAVRSDGSVERIRVVRSSGYEMLDDAAIRIVELAAPYSPFPPDIAAETDVLDIIRTWRFQRGGVLGWER